MSYPPQRYVPRDREDGTLLGLVRASLRPPKSKQTQPETPLRFPPDKRDIRDPETVQWRECDPDERRF